MRTRVMNQLVLVILFNLCVLVGFSSAGAEGIVRINLQTTNELDPHKAASRYDVDKPTLLYAQLIVDSLPMSRVKTLELGFELDCESGSIQNLGFNWAPGWQRLDPNSCDGAPEAVHANYTATPVVVGYWLLWCPNGKASSGDLKLTPNPHCRSDFIWAQTGTGLIPISRAYHASINSDPPPPTQFYPEEPGGEPGERAGQGICDNVMVNDWVLSAKGPSDIAVAPLQEAYVVWYDARPDRGVFFSKSYNGGQDWTTDVRVTNPDLSAEASAPAIALDPLHPSFIYVVSYGMTYGSSSSDVLFWRSDDGGDTWPGSPTVVNSNPSDECASPDVARSPNGDICVAWIKREQLGAYAGDVYFSRSSDNGNSWADAVIVNDDSDDSNWHQNPGVAVDPSGQIYVIWEDGRRLDLIWSDIYSSRSTDGGASWSSNVRVNDLVSGDIIVKQPAVVTPATDVVYVCWVDDRLDHGNCQTYFSSSLNGCSSWNTDAIVNDPTAYSCATTSIACFDLEERIYVTWADSRANPQNYVKDIFLSESIDGGANWTPDLMLNDDANSEWIMQSDPAIAIYCDFTGVCWYDQRDGETQDIYYCTCTAAASVSGSGDQGESYEQSLGGPNPTEGTFVLQMGGNLPGITYAGIYDVRGRLVRELLADPTGAEVATVAWDGDDGNGRRVSPGHYFLRITTSEGMVVRKVVVAR